MKFARRRATDDALPEGVEAPPAPDLPPRGRPVTSYAGVVDGERLWVAVEARPGRLGLRPAAGGDVIALPDHAADDQPAYTAACLDLSHLPAPPTTDPVRYDVVLTAGSKSPVMLWTPTLPPVTSRTARDGFTQFVVVRGPEGALQVARRTLPVAATLLAATSEPGALHVTLVGADALLAAVDDEGGAVATWDVVDQRATLTLASLDHVAPQVTRLMTGEPGAWRPIRRRGNDLADPGKAASMPPVFAAGADEPRFRLRWSPHAVLQLRVHGEDEA